MTTITEPVAFRVITNNTAMSFYLTRQDAEHGAKNRLTYVKGCTSAVVEPLFASPAVAPVAVSVKAKPLVWGEERKVPDGPWSETMLRQHIGHHNLGAFAGSYGVQEMDAGGAWGWWNSWTAERYPDGVEQTLETAKAAAQADFNARILSSIIPATKGGEDIETQAWECSKWPAWLSSIVDRTNEVADRLDMSSEQAHAYAVLAALAQDTDATPTVASAWQLIETAPKDDKCILVGGWLDDEWRVSISSYLDLPYRRGFRHRNGAHWARVWMPLPGEAALSAPTVEGETL